MKDKNFKKNKSWEHAIIVGSGIAGLLSARILSDYFKKCTIIESDSLPDRPEKRNGVPQTTQPHILFTKGWRILQELFPDIEKDLINGGALSIDWAREFYRFDSVNGWNMTAKSASGINSYTCSRPLIEWTIRKNVELITNITFIERTRVIGLLKDLESIQVTGVKIDYIDKKREDELQADLVVDAAGRRSQAPKWLKDIYFDQPEELIVNPQLGYATARYRPPTDYIEDWKVLMISHFPPKDNRLGYLAKIENGEWIATLGGFNYDHPPLNEKEFLEYAQKLPDLRFFNAIKKAKIISPILSFRTTKNRKRNYEKMNIPNGFISLGDSVCAVNPAYGQGITMCALGSIILRDWLNEAYYSNQYLLNSLSFQKKLAKSNSPQWKMSTTMDLAFPNTQSSYPTERKKGKKSNLIKKMFRLYIKNLQIGASIDPELHILLTEVFQLIKSPAYLFYPSTFFRVLRASKNT